MATVNRKSAVKGSAKKNTFKLQTKKKTKSTGCKKCGR